MTGRELIVYILSNNLEDKEVIEDGKLLGHIRDIDLAKEFNCGVATIHAHIQIGDVKAFKLGNTYYIPKPIKVSTTYKFRKDEGIVSTISKISNV